FLVATFPFLHRLDQYDEYLPIHERLTDFWHGEGVAHLDLRHALSGRSPAQLVVSAHDPHPSRLAHQLVADAIARFLDSHLRTEERRFPGSHAS
ncbi:MAG: hypothetical protein JSV80_18035, partial [Acidobacteriota bacterium]